MIRLNTLLLAGLVALGLTGCGGSQMVPQDQFYRLADDLSVSQLAQPVLTGSVAISSFKSTAIYHDRAIVYTEKSRPLELHQHHYHFWVDSPPRLLQDKLARTLRLANVAERVFIATASQAADYQILGTLHQFEQSIGSNEVSVNVALRLELVETASAERLLVKDYSITTDPVNSGNVYAAVEAFQQAVDKIMVDWVTELGTL